ncbi:MAG TPA: SMC-Scp complex subunit ScpB [Pirellulales bacterium]|jgi:segregation and condensation protein B|nr:SMC-Scp complex subunit ScpB [Pirellulales bacterium]
MTQQPPNPPRRPVDHGLPLDSVSELLAARLAGGGDPYCSDSFASEPGDSDGDVLPQVVDRLRIAQADDGQDHETSPRAIIEAMLFVGAPGNEPISAAQIAALMRGVRTAEIDEWVRELNAEYQANRCPYTIASVGEGYRMELRPAFEALREKTRQRVRQAKLSRAALEALALVAYRGPLATDEISRLRGAPSYRVLSQLVRRRLLAVERVAGSRKSQYRVTERFLQLFGLASLDELPRETNAEPG